MNTNSRNITRLDELINDECLVFDERLVIQKWAYLERACAPYFDIAEDDIKEGQTEARCINALFDAFDGIRIIAPLQIMSAYAGNAHGGRTDLYHTKGEQKYPHLNALISETSVGAMIDTFYAAFELPKKGCFWHGCYGLDYTLLIGARRLATAMQRRRGKSHEGDGKEGIDRPPGIRLIKRLDSYRLSCLAGFPNGEIVDMSLTLDGGRISTEPSETVLPATSLHLY